MLLAVRLLPLMDSTARLNDLLGGTLTGSRKAQK
jgi:hypothetical protein